MKPSSSGVLPPEFYRRPTLTVARELLGKVFVKRAGRGELRGRIVEVEAYHQREASAHSFRGPTRRNRVMFAPGGALYVYRIYGIHCCMNFVTEDEGVGAAVLIRALEPLAGEATMKRNRGGIENRVLWTNGPGKLCQAFGVRHEHDGLSLGGPRVFVEDAPVLKARQIQRSARIGISKAVDLPWRFYEKDNPFVSR